MKRESDQQDTKASQRIRPGRDISAAGFDFKLQEDGSLDVADFCKARQLEIKNLIDSMKRSKQSSNKLSFQLLPRFLRRRAASHDAKRVPKRLRSQHQVQSKDQKKTRCPEKLRKKYKQTEKKTDKSLLITSETAPLIPWGKYKRRQLDKSWLPTHIWHAKRAKMLQRWGFMIPKCPNDKNFRPTHRSHLQNCIAFDQSYYSTIVISGLYQDLLKVITIIASNGDYFQGIRYIKNGHVFFCMLRDIFAVGLWNEMNTTRQNCNYSIPSQILWLDTESDSNQILIRLHPVAKQIIINDIKSQIHDLDLKLHLADLSNRCASLAILGPKSSEALNSVIKSFTIKEADLNKSVPSSVNTPFPKLSSGVLSGKKLFINQVTYSCRKYHNMNKTEGDSKSSLFEGYQEKQAIGFAESFDEIIKCKTQNIRDKTEWSTPLLAFTMSDCKGWILILPWDNMRDFWTSLIRCSGILYGGSDNWRQIAHEDNSIVFPSDFVWTPLGDFDHGKESKEMYKKWQKRPASKRISVKSLDQKFKTPIQEYLFSCKILSKETESEMIPIEHVKSILKGSENDVLVSKYLNSKTSSHFYANITSFNSSIRDRARIYGISEATADIANLMFESRRNREQASAELSEKLDSKMLIGFCTNASFNFKYGKSVGIAVIDFKRFLEMKRSLRSEMLKFQKNYQQYCFVRNIDTCLVSLATIAPISNIIY